MTPPRRLPINLPPARHETLVSYLNRLANLHGLSYEDLWQAVTSSTGYQTRPAPAVDSLAHLTGRTTDELGWAMPELRSPRPDWPMFRHEPQPACPACTARHPGGPVFVILPHHRYVCARHRYWIGPPDTALPMPSLHHLPEIVTAQQRHNRLLHRHGWAITYDAVLTGLMICGWFWAKHDNLFEASMAGSVFEEWTARAAFLIPPGTASTTFTVSKLFATIYPEAISIAALIASPHWRSHAAGDVHQKRRFVTELALRLRWPAYQPRTVNDPIPHWMEYDAPKPPSTPPKTFATPRGFNTPKQLASHYHGKLATRTKSALWFSRNNKGGTTLLNHRHLRPVLIREWSPPMQEFAGAIWASQYTPPPDTSRYYWEPESDNYLPPPPKSAT